ncbi:MAG TPA: hypothetical protein VMB21_14625 [Candidatus Limnocylindria bacterium]|nr:hypothetical protein [Candidatus Limnocylindria bacterium]
MKFLAHAGPGTGTGPGVSTFVQVWVLRLMLCAGLASAFFGSAFRAAAFTAAEAETLFQAHAKAFYREQDGRAWFQESTEGKKTSFWMRA